MKRVRAETDSSGSGTDSDVKQRRVEVKSFQRWKKMLDIDYQTMTLTPGNKLVDKLKCKFVDRLEILDHWRITNIKIPLNMMSEQNVLMTDQV